MLPFTKLECLEHNLAIYKDNLQIARTHAGDIEKDIKKVKAEIAAERNKKVNQDYICDVASDPGYVFMEVRIKNVGHLNLKATLLDDGIHLDDLAGRRIE